MRGILLLDDDLIGECNELAGAALEQVCRPGEAVCGFLLSGGESASGLLFLYRHSSMRRFKQRDVSGCHLMKWLDGHHKGPAWYGVEKSIVN